MGNTPAFASVGEAMDMALAALGYLADADAAQLTAETQAECLRGLERADAISAAARAWFLSAFTAGKGYSADADYSVRAWLMHRTGITRGAAASHTAWAGWAATHPRVLAALAAGELSESYGRAICQWTGKLPEKYRDESDELLIAAAAAGLGLRDLAALFAEMYERAGSELPDEDPDGPLEDRALRLVTTFQGAGVLNGDLTPECAAAVAAVLDALSAPVGAEDTRTQDQRYHDALHEALHSAVACGSTASSAFYTSRHCRRQRAPGLLGCRWGLALVEEKVISQAIRPDGQAEDLCTRAPPAAWRLPGALADLKVVAGRVLRRAAVHLRPDVVRVIALAPGGDNCHKARRLDGGLQFAELPILIG